LRPVVGTRVAAPVALLVLAVLVVNGSAPSIVLAASMTLLVAACVARPDHGLRGCLEARALRFVGAVSYELYLVHVAAITAVKRLAPGHAANAPFVFACGLAAALPLAYVLHRAVGVPFEPLRARLRTPPASTEAKPFEAPSASLP
jgi:peptidoglycan/LPS O-acetylase OafA/YrhL